MLSTASDALRIGRIDDLNAQDRNLVFWGAGRRLPEIIETLTTGSGLVRRPDYVTDSTRQLTERDLGGVPILPFDQVKLLSPERTSLVITAGLLDLQAQIVSNELYYFDIRHCRSLEFVQYLASHWSNWTRSLNELSSDGSRMLYDKLAVARIGGSFFDPSLYTAGAYFGNSVVDCLTPGAAVAFAGAFNGKHIDRFLAHQPDCTITAFEPSADWSAELTRRYFDDDRVAIVHALLWDELTTLSYFDDVENHGLSAQVVTGSGPDAYDQIDTTTIDACFMEKKLDYLFLDVEGSEARVLQGAQETLRRDRPIVGVCTYHTPFDFVTLPTILRTCLAGDYRFEVLQHSPITSIETVLYAIPV